MKKFAYYLLISLLFFQGISGLFGGGALILDPSGTTLQMPLSMLDTSPFDNYMIPGAILFVVLGIFPIVVTAGLWREKIWAWLGAILVGAILLIWIAVEIAMIGYHSNPPLQLIYSLLGIVILTLPPMPSVKYRFRSNTLDTSN